MKEFFIGLIILFLSLFIICLMQVSKWSSEKEKEIKKRRK